MSKPNIENWDTCKKPVRLSTREMWFYRFVAPVILLAIPTGMIGVGFQEKPILIVLGSVALVMTLAFITKYLWRLKTVIAHKTHLEIQSLLHSVDVSYDQISHVFEKRLISDRPTKIVLSNPCKFGSEILYLPYFSWSIRTRLNTPRPANVFLEKQREMAVAAKSSDDEPSQISFAGS